MKANAPLAKLDIASVYGTEGQEFESLTVHQKHGRTTVLPCFCIIRTVRNPSSRECARGGSWVRSTERAENKQLKKPSMYCTFFTIHSYKVYRCVPHILDERLSQCYNLIEFANANTRMTSGGVVNNGSDRIPDRRYALRHV